MPDPQIEGGKLDGDNNSDFPNPPAQVYGDPAESDAAVAALKAAPSVMSTVKADGAIALNVLQQIAPALNVAAPGIGTGVSTTIALLTKLLGGLPPA